MAASFAWIAAPTDVFELSSNATAHTSIVMLIAPIAPDGFLAIICPPQTKRILAYLALRREICFAGVRGTVEPIHPSVKGTGPSLPAIDCSDRREGLVTPFLEGLEACHDRADFPLKARSG